MSFTTEIQVRFAHVDAAGIVFYPRYFEMLNQVVEDWFEGELGSSFRDLHAGDANGVPAVRVETDFLRPSRLGDRLCFTLDVVALGRSRIDLRVVASLGGEERVRVRLVLAYVSLPSSEGAPLQSCAIPDALRARMKKFLVLEPEPS